MIKKQRRIIGAILKIDLHNGYHSYGRILDKANYAFYEIMTKDDIRDVNLIVTLPVLFILGVYNDVITSNRWVIIGKKTLEDYLKVLPMEFIQDSETLELEIYDCNSGEIRPSTKEECEGLECAAVWEATHVEERIIDFFEGRINASVKNLSIR